MKTRKRLRTRRQEQPGPEKDLPRLLAARETKKARRQKAKAARKNQHLLRKKLRHQKDILNGKKTAKNSGAMLEYANEEAPLPSTSIGTLNSSPETRNSDESPLSDSCPVNLAPEDFAGRNAPANRARQKRDKSETPTPPAQKNAAKSKAYLQSKKSRAKSHSRPGKRPSSRRSRKLHLSRNSKSDRNCTPAIN